MGRTSVRGGLRAWSSAGYSSDEAVRLGRGLAREAIATDLRGWGLWVKSGGRGHAFGGSLLCGCGAAILEADSIHKLCVSLLTSDGGARFT
jgi:hypothetical protein